MRYFALLHRLAKEQNQAKQFCIIKLPSDASPSLGEKKCYLHILCRNGLTRLLELLSDTRQRQLWHWNKGESFPHFLLLNSVPEEKADFFWGKGHEAHFRKRRIRKKVKEGSVRRTTIGRRKPVWQPEGGEGHRLQLTRGSAQQHSEQEEHWSWNQQWGDTGDLGEGH